MSTANVVHHIPGRIRLHVASAKRDHSKLDAIEESLRELPGIRRVRTNATLGSIVIEYDPSAGRNFRMVLAGHAAAHRLFDLSEFNDEDDLEEVVSTTDRSLDRLASNVNQRIQALSGNTVNLKELFPFSLILYAVFFVDRAVSAAQWLNWLQFAFSSYMELHQAEPVTKVGQSIESLRAEIQSMHAELQQLARMLGG